jgi:hypothetical protein
MLALIFHIMQRHHLYCTMNLCWPENLCGYSKDSNQLLELHPLMTVVYIYDTYGL